LVQVTGSPTRTVMLSGSNPVSVIAISCSSARTAAGVPARSARARSDPPTTPARSAARALIAGSVAPRSGPSATHPILEATAADAAPDGGPHDPATRSGPTGRGDRPGAGGP